MRRLLLACASLAASAPAFALPAPQDTTPVVLAFQLGEHSVEAMAWRDANGELFVARETLAALNLSAPEDADDPTPLSAIRGLTYETDDASASVRLHCTATCFPAQSLRDDAFSIAPTPSGRGGFFNADLTATHIGEESTAAGLFELAAFDQRGLWETSWTMSSAARALVRLETRWTLDLPAERLRLRLGDTIMRADAVGTPFRFAGAQFGTDFSLQPSFYPLPTPSLDGSADVPSTVDLYVDGALRLSRDIDAGPFSIIDAPVMTGGGVAQIVVRDALGREQIFAQPFYASPSMLRAGLADYAVALGAPRLSFAQRSNNYGDAFASGFVRYGFTNWLTGEGRFEATDDHSGVGVSASVAGPYVGQVDVALAQSVSSAGRGEMQRLGWTYAGRVFSAGLEGERQSARFARLGEGASSGSRMRGAAFVGLDHRFGSASFALTTTRQRDGEDVDTYGVTLTPRSFGASALSFTYLRVEADETFESIGVSYSTTLGGDVSANVSAQTRAGRAYSALVAQNAPDPDGGLGWRALISRGDVGQAQASLAYIGPRALASVEIGRIDGVDGLRGTLQIGVAFVGEAVVVTRPIRDSFALVDVGAPGVRVMRDNRVVGVSNSDGRLLLTGLRPYEANKVGIELDDLPISVSPPQANISVAPAPLRGVVVRFALPDGPSGEVQIVDTQGAPTPAGTVLTRDTDGERFPIGSDGRTYVTGLADAARFTTPAGCFVDLASASIGQQAVLQCAN